MGGATENWFAYVLALMFLVFRPQGLFGEKIIERVLPYSKWAPASGDVATACRRLLAAPRHPPARPYADPNHPRLMLAKRGES